MKSFNEQLARWLRKHPTKPPPENIRTTFTAEVMSRVKDAPQPVRRATVIPFPMNRVVTLRVAGIAAVLLLVLGGGLYVHRTAAIHTAETEAIQDIFLLTELDEPLAQDRLASIDAVTTDILMTEHVVLAQQAPAIEAGLNQIIDVLDALDEPMPAPIAEPTDENGLIEEMLLLEMTEGGA